MSENDYDGGERRREARIHGAIVEYSLSTDDQVFKTAFMKDISSNGVGIYVHEPVDAGVEIHLQVYLFGNELPIQSVGKVVWSKKSGNLDYYQLGIKMIKIEDQFRRELDRYISDYGKVQTIEVPQAEGGNFHHIDDEDSVSIKDGVVKHFYGSGELLCEFNIVNGKIEGEKRTYFENGTLLEKLEWKNGVRHGIRQCYYANGKIKIEQEYKDGKKIRSARFDKFGNLISENL